jgi:hypothetical protein
MFRFDPARRILFFATKSPNTYLCNVDVARVICKAIRVGRLPRNCHLISRLHPIYYRSKNGKPMFEKEIEEWRQLEREFGGDCLSIDFPEILDGKLNFFMPDREIQKLDGILWHCDAVINIFSTLNIEACIFDRPIVNVGFQFEGRTPPGKKKSRFDVRYDEAQIHNQRIVRSGGTVIAYSPDQLLQQIAASLEEPAVRREGRKKIVRQECAVNLGRAGIEVGKAILEVAGSSTIRNASRKPLVAVRR